MSMKNKLKQSERDFFGRIARVAFANPFGEERERISAELADRPGGREETLDPVLPKVEEMLRDLDRRGLDRLPAFDKDDRWTMEMVYLFDLYHRARDPFDEHIRAQEAAGDEPIDVPFAAEMLSEMDRRGIPVRSAERYFGYFFQLRRAYYFIEHGLLGRAPSMRRLRMHLWHVVFSWNLEWYIEHLWDRMEDFSTLLVGETGTGKGAAAVAVGRSGFIPFDSRNGRFAESFARAFVSINLSQFPETLIESELFGHRKGAFTGAVEDHPGVFARCSPYGSIFLDEIGDVGVPIQIKLLQVLQERVYSPVGGHESMRFRGRVLAATNRPLDELRATGEFRNDFFYRLSSDVVEVPSLRQRLAEDPEELELLSRHLLQRITGDQDSTLEQLVLNELKIGVPSDYEWPGNVRELEQTIRRALLTRRVAPDRGRDSGNALSSLVRGIEQGALTADDLMSAYCALLYQRDENYSSVARTTGLDRRTVRKYVRLGRGEGED